MTLEGCVEAFLDKQQAGGGNLTSTGQELLDYGICIARHSADRTVEITTKKYSMTTTKHTNLVSQMAQGSGYLITYADF